MMQPSFQETKTTPESLPLTSSENQQNSLACPSSDSPCDAYLSDFLSNFYPDQHPQHLWGGIMDALQYGILILTPDHRLLYANSKAQGLCQSLSSPMEKQPFLSSLIQEICDRFYEVTDSGAASLLMEFLGQNQQTIRAKIHPLHQYRGENTLHNGETLILVLLENCEEKFQTELSIECKKYGLTEREAEVWKLLRQGHTYQEVAYILQLSLNTIKTHAKKIYHKQYNYRKDQQTIWFSH